MDKYIISYDLIGPNRDYNAVIKRIGTYPASVSVLESVWIVMTDKTAPEIRNDISSVMDSNDRIFVARLTGHAAWNNLVESKKIKDILERKS
ncbi:CRISPR-associated protein Cas2 [Lysinibacillus sphaericus]|uniref:CRISPR-associated protein Cas2 n=1 Tax=Lysinibacillus sphaericus TaxID=1421 RepID=UPI001A9F4327|nr:CRISPR-associated protein Cas2 [Lysinibacillus sphaericus]QTB26363.1 CRISPR-associated protein Cas2 [Lysinibacillus sphaericus]